MNKGPLVLTHKKNAPSANYYIKNDFPQKRERDVNLSQSINPKNISGLEQAAKNGLNQSRGSIAANATGTSSNNNINFRIGGLSNNVSREYSKKRLDLNVSEERSKPSQQLKNYQSQNTLPSTSSHPQKSSARVLISRNGSPKPTLAHQSSNNMAQQVYYHPHNQRSGQDAPGVDRARESGDDRKIQLAKLDQSDYGVSPKLMADTGASDKQAHILAGGVQEDNGATVFWADKLDNQDIRTELKFGDCLGQGSFAKVYEGFDKRLHLPVAIKVIDKRKIKDSETKKKALIEEEIFIFSKMNHSSIAKFVRLIEDVKRVAFILSDLYRDGAVWSQYPQYILQRLHH